MSQLEQDLIVVCGQCYGRGDIPGLVMRVVCPLCDGFTVVRESGARLTPRELFEELCLTAELLGAAQQAASKVKYYKLGPSPLDAEIFRGIKAGGPLPSTSRMAAELRVIRFQAGNVEQFIRSTRRHVTGLEQAYRENNRRGAGGSNYTGD